MTRPMLVAGAVWLAAVIILLAGAAARLWPSTAAAYLCGWLVLVSLPLGALPPLLVLELAGRGDAGLAAPLRLILASLPMLAVLFVPVLVHPQGVYVWQACARPHCPAFTYTGFGARWFSPGAFAARSVVYLVLWVGLSLYFVRPARASVARRRLAGASLAAHGALGTLAAFDWFMALDAGHVSSNYGVLVMLAQCAFALTMALLLQLAAGDGRPGRGGILAVLVLVGAASYAQFAEYLVVWSANLPREIAWYQDRPGGHAFAVGAVLLLMIGCVLLLPERLGASRILAGAALGMFVLVAVGDLILLGSPRGLFVRNLGATVAAVVALGGLAAPCAHWLGGAGRHRFRHG